MSVKSHSASSVCTEQRSKKNASSRISEDCHEEEMDDKGIIKRKSRNLSEKKRRDQFNVLINELCSMVCTGKRKIDKSTVLKSAISFIRNHNQVAMQSQSQEVQEDWKPSFLSNEEFTHLMLEALDGFIMVLTATGKILYISENITCLLGHIPNDLVGTVIYDLIWEEEREQVQTLLRNWASVDQLATGRENHVSLSCHLRRGNSRDYSLESNYELVLFSGYYRIQSNLDVPTVSNVSVSSCGDESKGSSCGDSISQHDGLVFVATARLQTPQLIVEMSLVDVSKSEFTSRHSLEWKFLFLDHRAPPIIGYLPFEVLGTSGYDYYHVDDLDKVSACHEALMQKGEGTSCCYRFLTKGQQWIWLQTRYYITYHQWNSKPEFIVCTHKVVSYNEVIGHPVKETSTTKNEKHCSSGMEEQMMATVTTFPNSKTRSASKSSSSANQSLHKRSSTSDYSQSASSSSTLVGKMKQIDVSWEDGNSCKRDGHSSSGERSKNSPKISGHQRQQQPQSHAINRDSPVSDPVLLPPPALPMPEPITQHNRHPSGSSRGVGAAMSDAGSISSSGSFHSAASQHSRQSDQSMQSLHSQQSHHSMQSAHSQMSQQSQSIRSSSQASSVHPSNSSNQQQNKHLSNSQQQQHYGVLNSCQSRLSSTQGSSRANSVETYFSSPITTTTSTTVAGHRFLQPHTKNVNSNRRNSSGNGQVATSVNAVPVSSTTGTMYQPVLPLGIEENSNQGVTLPLQHVIEGLPVVTLPGLVAHEPIRMTVAQRQLHEQLRLKHAQLQRQIAAQQEELRRVSEQLILAQYGAWGSTVLKMTVPYTEAQVTTPTSNQPTHAILSAGGLVTCLTGTPVGIGQSTSSQLGTGSTTPVTFSPGTPILVQSPSIIAHSPPADSICMTTDPPQVVLRTASQQDTLVQLTQQDVQMLLAQSLLQDTLPPSTEYL